MLFKSLMKGDQAMMRAMARQSVKRYAGMEPGRPVGGTYYLYRTLRNLNLDGMLERLMEQAKDDSPEPLSPLEERLERDEYEHRIDDFRKEIESEIRRRLVADRGVEAMAKTLRKPLPEDIDFMHASREEMVQLRKALQPLTRRLGRAPGPQASPRSQGCTRLPQHRAALAELRRGAGRAEVQVPTRPAKPEIFVIADISGSVAAFARFTLHLVYAISGQFSKVRSFVFIDGLDEVTRFFEGTDDIVKAIPRQQRGRRGLGRRPLGLRPRVRGSTGSATAPTSAPRRP